MSKKKVILLSFFVFIVFIFYIGTTIGTSKFQVLKSLVPDGVKNFLIKTVFVIPSLKKEIMKNRSYMNEIDKRISKYEKLQSINGFLFEDLIIKTDGKEKNYRLKKYIFNANFIEGESNLLNKKIPRRPAGYLAIDQNRVLVVSGKGTIKYFDKNKIKKDKIELIDIDSNLISFFEKDKDFFLVSQVGVRDILIKDNFLYLSFNNLKKENCYNIPILRAELNYDKLNFEMFFDYDECIEVDKVQKFFVNQSGGRIIGYSENEVLFSTGSMRAYYKDESQKIILEQLDESKFGKVLKVNLSTSADEVFTKGHRNPQGLYFDQKRSIVLETEHGPKGGDEINLLKEKLNYGWPISSYGVHYDGKFRENAPLNKSHKDHGFEEPLKYWSPGIGISQLDRSLENDRKILVTSMKNESIHILNFNENFNEIENYDVLNIEQRIRDIVTDLEDKQYF